MFKSILTALGEELSKRTLAHKVRLLDRWATSQSALVQEQLYLGREAHWLQFSPQILWFIPLIVWEGNLLHHVMFPHNNPMKYLFQEYLFHCAYISCISCGGTEVEDLPKAILQARQVQFKCQLLISNSTVHGTILSRWQGGCRHLWTKVKHP